MAMTQEQIQSTIKAARDSVWVIDNSLEKLSNGAEATDEIKGNIDRNVSHLKIIVGSPEITNSGEDISDLYQAITDGEDKLAELNQ